MTGLKEPADEKTPTDEGFLKKDHGRFSWLEFKEHEELQDDEEAMYPADCYSFLALGCGPENRIPFAYGLMVWVFQIIFLILMICSKVNRSMSANEDIDNPDETGFAQYMPANASLVVRTTQFVAILAFVIFAEDSISDVVDAVRYCPLPVWSTDNIFVTLAAAFRFTQGTLACFTVFLLVMVSEDVIDIVLNFTAVNFISTMDDAAFEIASLGRYGNVLKKRADEIENTIHIDYKCLRNLKLRKVITKNELGEEEVEDIDIKYKWYIPTVSFIALLLLSFSAYVADRQQRDGSWEAQVFRVEFDEETGLVPYSGCFDDIGRNSDRRAVYKARNYTQQNPATLEYCKQIRRWVIYEDTDGVPGDACDGTGLVAQSEKTNSFSVTTAFEVQWFSAFRKPLEMYFLENLDGEEFLFCDQFANDGSCDSLLNNYDYQFDGGDCCGMTCSHDNCGNNVFTAFNEELSDGAIGYPSCVDSEMVDFSVALDKANFENVGDDLELWMGFWSPRLSLECGEENEEKNLIFSIPVSQSMFGYAYDEIKVGSESVCNLIANNFEPFFGSLNKYFSVNEGISFAGLNATYVNVISQNFIPSKMPSSKDITSLNLGK